MRRKSLTALVLLMLTSLVLVSCGAAQETTQTATEAEPAASESNVIGFALPNISTPFFTTMVDGARAVAGERGFEVEMVNADNDPAVQASQLEDFIARGVAAIIITPVDKDAARPFVDEAREAGILVIAADRGMEGVDGFVEADNLGMGVMAAEEMARLLTEKYGEPVGQVAEFQGSAGNQAAIDRGAGFNDTLVEKYPDIEVVASQDAQFDAEQAFNFAQNLLVSNPDIDGYYYHSDVMLAGALRAVEAAGMQSDVGEEGHIIHVSIDGDNFALSAIRDGLVDVTISQDPPAIGATAAEQIFRLMDGENIQEHIQIPPVVVTRENADDPNLWGNAVSD